MEKTFGYKEYDVVVAEVLGYLLNKKDNIVFENFDINNHCHLFYIELLKMTYTLSSYEIYYKTNWFKYIIAKIFCFKKDKIKLANKKSKGYRINFNTLHKELEFSEELLAKIYKEYYYNK